MSYYPRSNETMDKLLALGHTGHNGVCMKLPTLPAWQFNRLELGCIEAVRRYGHHAAARMMAKARLPVWSAYRLIRIAMQHGVQYRRPMHRLFTR